MLPVSCYGLDGPAAFCRRFLVPALCRLQSEVQRGTPPSLNLATLSFTATGSHHFHWADEQMVFWHWQTIGRWLHLCDFCHSFDPLLKMSDLSVEVEKGGGVGRRLWPFVSRTLVSMCLDGRATLSIKAKEGAGSIKTGH